MASPNLSEIVTTTLRNRSRQIADNVTSNNAVLMRLSERGKVRPFSGGQNITQELSYAENSTAMWYSGYETLDISPADTLTAAEFTIKQAAVSVSISGLEELQNSGKERMVDLLEARIENAERTLQNTISVGLYSDGTGSSGKQLDGLQSLVADTPTSGTVGGINRATYSFWQNVSYDATTDGGAAATSSNIQTYMNAVYAQLVRGTDRPDLILADNNYWSLYLASLQANQRFTNEKLAALGFMNVKYFDADFVLDGGFQQSGGGAPTNHAYFLNSNYLHFRPHSDRNFVPLNPDRFAVNQDAMVKLIAFAGNLTASNCSLQGVLKD